MVSRCSPSRRCALLSLLISNLALSAGAVDARARPIADSSPHIQAVIDQTVGIQSPVADASTPFVQIPPAQVLDSLPQHASTSTTADANVLHDLHNALAVMQDHYFALWLGKWTTAIDWTAAVTGTYVSATLSSLSRSIDYTMPGTFDKDRKVDVEALMIENDINKYFTQSVSYYFGEDHFAIRMQAFDDILWVVLGWLESTQFIESHSGTHYTANAMPGTGRPDDWHASQFIPAFAHRARVFYELAEKGWDWRLCGGGMTWNPRLLPYKNAITNQLFISASISMYLHFPGDENCSPFLSQYDAGRPRTKDLNDECEEGARGRYDPIYLANAVNGYEWLKNSGMMNDLGLYVDGFHIQGYRWNHSKTTCDERNEMVYTYNQGVVLSGLRGLWEATGNVTYLEDGHELIRNVIRATGWTDSPSAEQHVREKRTKNDTAKENAAHPSNWSGLGRNGILTELCDPSGRCNQDGQTFKGVFFHHLTAFCTPLPARAVRPGKTHASTRETAVLHQRSCNEYLGWVVHNAQAAMRTRDSKGRFGAWWGAPNDFLFKAKEQEKQTRLADASDEFLPRGAVDYRNEFVDDYVLDGQNRFEDSAGAYIASGDAGAHLSQDWNGRGRGRTVETQGSGLAVVRAMLEFLKRKEKGVDLSL
ncbi:glycoside hydrolase family 76 protein [Plenodomus tracheiphilus IPT5]|uniref:Glycoside hydrolase family 76 protein n=1 Tax=Plenodomus tracheiphilus IPT5 TaxID=1408161 RepID=A0A6A7B2B1_9PLEO|nr:glycoside hydrolase family 76 protein [Plenodomus tracheiphilus IPT5]